MRALIYAEQKKFSLIFLMLITLFFHSLIHAQDQKPGSPAYARKDFKRNQTITFLSLPQKTYGDAPFAISAKASSCLPVSFSSSDTTVAKVHGDTVTIVGAGTALITASQPGNCDYNAAPDVTQQLVVNKAVLTATADNQTKVAGTPNPTFTITYSGFKFSDNASVIDVPPVASSSASDSSAPGTYEITVSGGSDNNYSFSYVSGTLTITGVPPNVYATMPADGAKDINSMVTVTARLLSGATTYTIDISPSPDFSSGVITMSGTRSQRFTGLLYSTTYFVRVKTDLSPLYGKTTSFTTGPPELFTYVVNPMDMTSGLNARLNVSSTMVTGAGLYTIELNTASDFTGNAFIQSDSSRTQNFSGLSFNTTYYTRVKTDLSSNYGKSTQFTTGTPEKFTYVMTPTNGSTGANPISQMVTATLVEGASDYTIELSTDSTFATGVISNTGGRMHIFENLGFLKVYYGRVKTDLTSNYGKKTSFKTLSAATQCYVTNPMNNAVNVSWLPTITVHNIGATSYTLELSPVNDFSSGVISMTSSTNKFVFSTPLTFETIYYSRVTSDLNPGQYGPIRSFTTDTPVRHSFITSPKDSATNVNYVVNLVAASVKGATTYTIEANTASDFTGTSIVKMGGMTQSFMFDYDTKYFVRVSTDLAPGEWGITKSFTTGDPLSLAYVINPKDGATGVSTSPMVSTNALFGATSYTIELNTASDFSGTSFVKTSPGRSKSFTGLTTSTTYYARVQSSLNPGTWGAATSFTTAATSSSARTAEYVSPELDAEISLTQNIQVDVFPNPAPDYFRILVASDFQQDISFKMFDMKGNEVHSSAERTNRFIEAGRELSRGIYVMMVNTPSGSRSLKVIKE